MDGADPSGVRDSSPAFQRAVNAGGAVWVPRGRYQFQTCVRIGNPVTIFAAPGTAVLQVGPQNTWAAQRGPARLFVVAGTHDVEFRDLTFDGSFGPGGCTDPRLRINYVLSSSNVVFDRCRFQNMAGSAVVFAGSPHQKNIEPVNPSGVSGSGVTGCTFDRIGLWWLPRYRAMGSTGVQTDAPQAIIFANGASTVNLNNFALDNTFTNLGDDAIDIIYQGHFQAARNHIRFNHCEWTPRDARTTYGDGGIYVVGSQDVSLIDNEIDGASANGYDIFDSRKLTIEGGVTENNGGAGITIGGGGDIRIHHVRVRDNYQSGSTLVPNVPHQGGLAFSCGKAAHGMTSNIEVSQCSFIDDQTRPTQPYGIWVQKGDELTGTVAISTDNVFRGNAIAPVFGIPPGSGN